MKSTVCLQIRRDKYKLAKQRQANKKQFINKYGKVLVEKLDAVKVCYGRNWKNE